LVARDAGDEQVDVRLAPTPILARVARDEVPRVSGQNRIFGNEGLNSASFYVRGTDVGLKISGRISKID
jgi:hypothetical protein